MQTSPLASLLLATRPAADNQQGVALQQQGRQDEAAARFRQALVCRPNFEDALNNLALAWQAIGAPEQAILGFSRALRVAGDDGKLGATLLNNLGLAQYQAGKLGDAAASFQRCLGRAPDHRDARHNLAIALLQQGNYREGWAFFEQRQRSGEPRRFEQPQWSGEPANGRTLLVWGEQGYGDQIQMVRYLPELLRLGWRVVLEAPAKLSGLFAQFDGVTLVARGETLPPFDCHCPLLSLPRAFDTLPDTIPADIPYLWAEPDRVEFWRRRLPPGRFQVGIAWQGNPSSRAERGRSAPLADFAPLARVPGVTLISLQKHHGLKQLAQLPTGMTVADLGAEFDAGPHALLDSAAVMMSLDLVITIDSVLGHLAGALGRPVWLALQKVPHWVWPLEGSHSPWYPRTRLFRQTIAGAWPGVFADMARELNTLLQERQ